MALSLLTPRPGRAGPFKLPTQFALCSVREPLPFLSSTCSKMFLNGTYFLNIFLNGNMFLNGNNFVKAETAVPAVGSASVQTVDEIFTKPNYRVSVR